MLHVDKDRWPLIRPLLDEAMDLDHAGRAAWLADLERRCPDLAPILSRLLTTHEQLLDSDFLDSPLAFDETPPTLAGRTVGAYTLEAPLGAGGMGTVWRARRSDGRFEGAVAVKLLNLALVGHDGDHRFKREGTLLARLAHEHIARLLDAGVSTTGQPYLVLEYVDGTRIDRYADEHRLNARQRLELFLQVADTVAHAHAYLIIHRDLKPSNILVSGDGQIKLLDFGIAKLLQDSDREDATLTGSAAQALTPEYAAPEQARGEAVTTATDVYALGVLLHVLLTGCHPTAERCRTPAEQLHALFEREPAKASNAVIDATASEPAERASARASTPQRLRRTYQGDIDNMLAKALEKDPRQRYASTVAFTDEVRRFLAHEPLTVRPQRWSYRAARFVRRHRWPVAAAAVAFVVLSAGLLVVNRQRNIAESRFRQLRHLSQQVFQLDARVNNVAGATAAREQLVAISLEYLEGLTRDGRNDLDLMQEVSEGYWRVARIQGVPTGLSLGNLAQAEISLAKADALLERILAARPRDRRALQRSAIVAADRMIVADSERRQTDALGQARKAVARMDALRSLGPLEPTERDDALVVYGNAATASINLHKYEEGIAYAQRQLEVARKYGAPHAESFGLSVLANALRSQGDLEGALTTIREARAALDRAAPEANVTRRMLALYPLLLREAFILGEDQGISLNRPSEAAVVLREALDINQAGARRDPNDTTSRTRAGTAGRELGDILRWEQPREALVVYNAALARLAEIPNNVKARRDRARVLANSSYALRRLNRHADARKRVDEALAILEATKDYPSDRISLGSEIFSVLHAQADQRADEGKGAEAVRLYTNLTERVLAAQPDIENDLREANSLSILYANFARVCRAAHFAADADALDAKRLAIWQNWDRVHPNNMFVQRQLAEITTGTRAAGG
jgi:serine/threonine-protein kinase